MGVTAFKNLPANHPRGTIQLLPSLSAVPRSFPACCAISAGVLRGTFCFADGSAGDTAIKQAGWRPRDALMLI